MLPSLFGYRILNSCWNFSNNLNGRIGIRQMTDFELEERIKDKFESVCNKLVRLNIEYENDSNVMASLLIIANAVGSALGRTNLHLTFSDQKYPILIRIFANSQKRINISVAPILPPMSLQECFDFMERTDKTLDIEEEIIKLANQIKGGKR